MSARSWCETGTQGVFVSVIDKDATEDNVLGPPSTVSWWSASFFRRDRVERLSETSYYASLSLVNMRPRAPEPLQPVSWRSTSIETIVSGRR